MNSNRDYSLRARLLFPSDGPPIWNGTVEVRDGVVAAIHDRCTPRADDLGNVAIIPGLVNAHTHLEFGHLSSPIAPANPFTKWVRNLVAERRERDANDMRGVAQGYRECVNAGTRIIGEIATSEWPSEVGEDGQAEVVVFREILGLRPEQRFEQLEAARRHLEAVPPSHTQHGISPHAPYSVHPELYLDLVNLCREHDAPLAVHLAETPAELELLADGRGEFVEMLSAFGVWNDTVIPSGTRPLDYLKPLADLPRAAVIHGNYLDDAEIDFLSQHPNITVVYCPRTHAYFGHAEHPWKRMIAKGARVALGTDSRASNPDLSLWREVQFLLSNHTDVPPEMPLRMATLYGAIALIGTDATRLAVGESFRATVLQLPETDTTEPYLALRAAEPLPLVHKIAADAL